MKRFILTVSFFSGFAALSNEVLWTKFLSQTLGTSTYALSIVLFSFLAGLAIGSYIAGVYLDRIKNTLSLFAFIELGIGLSGFLVLLFLDKLDMPYLRLHAYFLGSFYLFMASLLLLTFLLLMVPTTFMGTTLPVMGKILTKDFREVGTVMGNIFSANTLGGVIGAFAAGFILVKTLGLIKTGVFASGLNLLLAGIIFYRSERKSCKEFVSLLGISLLIGLYVSTLVFNPAFAGAYYSGIRHETPESWEKEKESRTLLFQGANEYGVVSVWREPNNDYLSINGKVDAGTSDLDTTTQYFSGYLPMFAKQDAKKVLGIGLGIGGTLSAIENFDEEKIDWVEINPLVVRAARDYFSDYNDHALNDSRLNLIIGDGRNYLLRSKEKYDVIVSEPSNIWVSESGPLFTKEFFELVKDHLEEGGIFSGWVPAYESNEEDMKIYLNTINQVFPHVSIWLYGGDKIILASNDEIKLDYYRLMESVYGNRRIYSDFLEVEMKSNRNKSAKNIENSLLKGYLGEYNKNLKKVQVNTDDLPRLEFTTLKNSMSREGGYVLEFNSSQPLLFNETVYRDEVDVLPLRIRANIGNNWSRARVSFSSDVVETFFENNGSQIKIKAFEFDGVEIYPDDSAEVRFAKSLLAESKVKAYMGINVYAKAVLNNHSYLLAENFSSRLAGWYCEENSRIYIVEVKAENPDEIIKNIKCYHTS